MISEYNKINPEKDSKEVIDAKIKVIEAAYKDGKISKEEYDAEINKVNNND